MVLRYSCHLPRALPLRPAARGAQPAAAPQQRRRWTSSPQKPPARCRCRCTVRAHAQPHRQCAVETRHAPGGAACPDRLLGSCFWCLDDAGCLARSHSPASRQLLPVAAGVFVLGLGDVVVVGDWIAATACMHSCCHFPVYYRIKSPSCPFLLRR
jgi:hypothetical protein